VDDDDIPPGPAPGVAAHLLIHATAGNGRSGRFELPLRRLLARHVDDPWHDESVPLRLRIDDLQGNQVVAVDDAGPLVDVPLTAGTYRVNVQRGPLRRSYTLTLEQGTSFDLHLRLPSGRR
jgi:hypothetical protein